MKTLLVFSPDGAHHSTLTARERWELSVRRIDGHEGTVVLESQFATATNTVQEEFVASIPAAWALIDGDKHDA